VFTFSSLYKTCWFYLTLTHNAKKANLNEQTKEIRVEAWGIGVRAQDHAWSA